MTKINNIEVYNKRMAKAIQDKLWFTQFLNQPQFQNAIVFDLGCADGELIRNLAPEFPDMSFIGVDISEEMIKLAESKAKYENECYILQDCLAEQSYMDSPRILIMSSVFHEIWSYQQNPHKYLEDILKLFNADYIFFRDMAISESARRNSNLGDATCATRYMEERDQDEFYNYWNSLYWQVDLIHYLLKYRYTENWDREVAENYIPVYLESIPKCFPGYNVVYSKHYTLQFLKEQVKKDMNINLMDNTHVNIIFKKAIN